MMRPTQIEARDREVRTRLPESLNDESAVPVGTQDTSDLMQALRDVRDPELPISIVDLGLVYAIRRDGGRVEVDITFTATGCPCMAFIRDDVHERLLREPGIEEVFTRVVWDPPWTSERLSEEGRATLRRYGVAA